LSPLKAKMREALPAASAMGWPEMEVVVKVICVKPEVDSQQGVVSSVVRWERWA
jgi:hypothetical protein